MKEEFEFTINCEAGFPAACPAVAPQEEAAGARRERKKDEL
jgi:hypothetical protein